MQEIVDNEQLKEALASAERVLLTCGTKGNLENVSSLLALYRILENRGKEITPLALNLDKGKYPFLPSAGGLVNELPSRSLELKINYQSDSVEKINYENEEGAFKLYFTPYPQEFNKDQIEINFSGLEYDLIITIGVTREEELGILKTDYPQVLDRVLLINIDSGENNTMFGQLNLVDSTARSNAEPVYQVIESCETPLDMDSATLLLTSIMSKTQNMRTRVSPRLLRFSASLLEKGADWEKALDYLSQAPSIKEERVAPEPQKAIAQKVANKTKELYAPSEERPQEEEQPLNESEEVTSKSHNEQESIR